MTEENNPQNLPAIAINAQYVKDLSFESPNAPAMFSKIMNAKPRIDISLDLEAKAAGEDLFEVVLHISSKAELENEVVFIVDLKYAGLFTLANIPDEQKEPILLIHCPTILFPFARRVIADLTRDGQFSPLMIDPIDFNALYVRRKQENTETVN